MSNKVLSIVDLASGDWMTHPEINDEFLEFLERINEAKTGRQALETLMAHSREAVERKPALQVFYPCSTYKPVPIQHGTLLEIETQERIQKYTPQHVRHGPTLQDGRFEREVIKCFYNDPIHDPNMKDELLNNDRFRGGDTYFGTVITGRYRYNPLR